MPADIGAWTVDPFAGVVGAGYVIGRGALDAKGVTVTHLLALVEAKRRGLALGRDVILLATPDEEAVGRGGAALLAERPDLLGGARYLLTEGGGILPGEGVSPDVWGVAFTEKTPCWVTLSARGLPGHGAGPHEDAAAHRLVHALERVLALRHETKVVPPVAQMFAALAPIAAPEDRAGYASLRGALALDPGFRASRKDSQDLCFLAGEDYRTFLQRNAAGVLKPGVIVTRDGKPLGEHNGLANYTIGQRKGLGVASPVPLYVLGKNSTENTLIVGTQDELGSRELTARDVNWVSGEISGGPFRAEVKIRYTAKEAEALVIPIERTGSSHV